MKKRKVCIYAALLALIGVAGSSLASCNKEDDSLKIPFWTTFSKSQQTRINEYAEDFEKYILETENVKIDIIPTAQGGYNEIEGKIIKGFSSGKLPTIAVAYPDHVAKYLREEIKANKVGQYVVKLDDYINDEKIGLGKEDNDFMKDDKPVTDFVPSFLEEGQNYVYDGTYSLPYMKSTEIMLYNKEKVEKVLRSMNILKSADRYMKEDLTWDNFMAMLNHINENPEKFGMQNTKDQDRYPLFYDSDANLFITQCFQRGFDYIDFDKETKTGKILFNNDDVKGMLKEFNELHQKGIMLTKLTNNNEYGSDFFINENCIFCVGSTGGSGYSDPLDNFEVGVCKFPTYKNIDKDHQKYVSQGITLCLFQNPNFSKETNKLKTDYAWRFMKYITNTKNSVDACLLSNGYIPARTSSYESDDYVAYLQQADQGDYMAKCAKSIIYDINGNYFNYPVFAGSSAARIEVGKLVNSVLQIKDADPTTKINEYLKIAYDNTILQMPAS